MDSLSVEELSCPVCFEIFKGLVLLSCSHSVCKACLQQFWRTKNTQECSVCWRRSSEQEPPYNLALKNLCESFLRDRRENSSEDICSSHIEKLKLFHLKDKQPVCLVCRDSQKHANHTFLPIEEVVPSYKAQSTQPDSEMCCGALIDVPHYLGNLAFTVWRKMQDIVQNTPVVLDPKTASPQLVLSDDLTSLTHNKSRQPLPDNLERFDFFRCVLVSEGFKSGTHCWDVEVGNNSAWTVGIIAASYQRKGDDFFKDGVWYVQYTGKEYLSQSPEQPAARTRVKEKLRRMRVQLDWDSGNLSFSDPVTNTQLRTFKTTFTETVFPFFQSICETSPLRIVPVKVKSALSETASRYSQVNYKE